jgi:hypothetical protein
VPLETVLCCADQGPKYSLAPHVARLKGLGLMKIVSMVAGFSLWFAALGGMPGAYADELVQVAQHRATARPMFAVMRHTAEISAAFQ